ncbi:MAG: O-antigen ligase family protein [Candidatus Lambdaproteobacteria bacterium]|nr:O-antigen ligase family protein [Candidatus Lambdaproteobacteria bacterium]
MPADNLRSRLCAGFAHGWLRCWTYLLFLGSPFSLFATETSVIALYGGLLALRWRPAPEQRLPAWVWLPFIAVPLAALVSALANPDPLGNLAALRGLFRLGLPLALVASLALVDRRRLLQAMLVPLVVMAVYGAIQYHWGVDWYRAAGGKRIAPLPFGAGGVFHAQGTFSHHLTYVGYMLMALVLYTALLLDDRGRERRGWAAGAAAAGVAVLLSMGRSGWLGALAGLLTLLARLRWRIGLSIVTAVSGVVALVGLLAWDGRLEAWLGPNQPGVVQRLALSTATHTQERLYLWEAGLLAIRDRPLLGMGLGNDRREFEPYRRRVAAERGGTYTVRAGAGAHNVYIQVPMELGLLGLAAYLWLWGAQIAWCIVWLRRAGDRLPFERALLWGALGGMAGSMVAGVFENNFFDKEVQTMMLMLMGLALHAGLRVRTGLGSAEPARLGAGQPGAGRGTVGTGG